VELVFTACEGWFARPLGTGQDKGSSSFEASPGSAEGLSGNVSLFSSVCSSFTAGGSEGGDGVVSTPEVSSRSGSDAVSKFSVIGPGWVDALVRPFRSGTETCLAPTAKGSLTATLPPFAAIPLTKSMID
jgi:hypothetical protein